MYTIKQASLRSGVGIPLLRAWERRYGVVRPVRTPAGYRLYDDEAIERLRAMRRLVEAGWAPREAAPRVRAATSEELEAIQGASPDAGGPLTAEAERLVARIADAARTMEQDELEGALDSAFSSARFEPAVQEVVLPAMVEVGAAWARGEMSVAAEHAASAAVLRRLGAAFQAAGLRASGPTVVVGLPPGSHHELAALAFATAARRAGVDVVYLGQDVPVESWIAAVRDTEADAVVLGAVIERDAAAAGDVLAELEAVVPSVVRAVGGRHAGTVPGIGHLVLPAGISDAVAALVAELGGRRGSARGPRQP